MTARAPLALGIMVYLHDQLQSLYIITTSALDTLSYQLHHQPARPEPALGAQPLCSPLSTPPGTPESVVRVSKGAQESRCTWGQSPTLPVGAELGALPARFPPFPSCLHTPREIRTPTPAPRLPRDHPKLWAVSMTRCKQPNHASH